MAFVCRRARSSVLTFVFGLCIGWQLVGVTDSPASLSVPRSGTSRTLAAHNHKTLAPDAGTTAIPPSGDLLLFAELIPRSPAPLPSGYPPQPPAPVGTMPLQQCLEYIRSRKWTGMSDPRSQTIACTPLPPLNFLRLPTGCQDIGAPPFAVTLCWNETSGEAIIRIVRTEACASDARFSDDTATVETVRRRFGPDSFRMRLDGPEVLVADLSHEGACRYSGRLCLTISGWYTLQAAHLFGRFHAVTELLPITQYALAPVTKKRYRVGFDLHPNTPCARSLRATPCSLEGLTHGRWVRPEAVRGYLDPFPPWKFPRVPGKNLAEAHSWGSDAVWTPYNCTWRLLAQPEARVCLANTSLLFIGDSMTRSFFYPFLNKLWENKIQGNPKITVADGPRVWTVAPNIRLQYSPDPFLTEPSMYQAMLQSTDYDIVVLGMGDWPASSTVRPKGLWPFARYRSHIDAVARDLAAFVARTGTRVLWHTIPAFGIADFDAWRNNQRFQLYNEYCVRRFRAAGIPVLDLFAVSIAMTHTAHDGGHFTGFVADVWAELLTFHLCAGNATVRRRR